MQAYRDGFVFVYPDRGGRTSRGSQDRRSRGRYPYRGGNSQYHMTQVILDLGMEVKVRIGVIVIRIIMILLFKVMTMWVPMLKGLDQMILFREIQIVEIFHEVFRSRDVEIRLKGQIIQERLHDQMIV